MVNTCEKTTTPLANSTTGIDLYLINSCAMILKISEDAIASVSCDQLAEFCFDSDRRTTCRLVSRYTYEKISEIKEFLAEKFSTTPRVGIICGSGLGSMGEAVKHAVKIDYQDIPNFPVCTVVGHKGSLIFGYVSNVPVVCLQGRFHYYEGYSLTKCVMPVRLMKLLGVTHLIASNAAGGLNPSFEVGDIMLIKDHLNFMSFAGNNPLIGANDTRFGPRFLPITNAYNRDLLKGVKEIVSALEMQNIVKEGVYTCLGGPCFETVAELRALRTMGVDAVGMSTVSEVIAARHCGIECFAFSLITNICPTEYDCDIEATSDDVLSVGKSKEKELKIFLENVIEFIGKKCIK